MKKYIIILMLLPTVILAQYNGGTGDGFTSKLAIVDNFLSKPDFNVPVANISVAPNPTASIINVTLDNNENLEINARLYDVLGRVIKDELFNSNKFEIDLSNQKAGVYILHLLNEGKLIGTQKLLKL